MWEKNIFFVIYLFRKIIQYCILSGKSMWISWISSSFKSESRVHLCRGVFSTWPVSFKEQGSIKVWSCLWKWIMSRTKEITEDLGKRVDVLIRLEKATSLKSLDSTNPPLDRLCTNGGHLRALLSSREVVDQQRSLQSRTCNSLRGW